MKLDGINLEDTLCFAKETIDLDTDVGKFIFRNIERGLYRTSLEYLYYEQIDFRLQQMVSGLFLKFIENKDGKLYQSVSLRYKLEDV